MLIQIVSCPVDKLKIGTLVMFSAGKAKQNKYIEPFE
jgi:hypothetical protein